MEALKQAVKKDMIFSHDDDTYVPSSSSPVAREILHYLYEVE